MNNGIHMDSIKNEILLAQQNNCLLVTIADLLIKKLSDKSKLILIIKDLHSSGKINIIDAILNYNKDSYTNKHHQLYRLNIWLDSLLMDLDIDLLELMKCSLIIEQNMAIRRLCSEDQNKADQFFNLVLANLDEFGSLLSTSVSTFDINTFNYRITNLINIITDPKIDISIKQQLLFTLSQLSFIGNIEDKDINQILKKVEQIIDQNDNSSIHGNILYLLVIISVHFLNKEKIITNLADKIWLKQDDNVIQITAGLIFNIKNIPNYLTNKIVDQIIKLDLLNLEKCLTRIDLSIEKLFESNVIKACFLLENLLIKDRNKFLLTSFESTLYSISESEKLSNYLITKWLLSSEYILQRNCSVIINHRHKDDKTITVDTFFLDLNKKNICLFLAQKVCGWLFFSPTSIISFILTLLDIVQDKKEKDKIINLLFSTVVLNYPNTFQDFIDEHRKSFTPKIKKITSNLLEKYKDFLKINEIEETISELHPSLPQKEKYHKYRCDINDQMNENVRKNSLFGEAIPTVINLYGNNSLYYCGGINGGSKALQKTPMHKYSYSSELPLQSVVDNSSLEYLLFTFRVQEYIL